MPRDLPVGNGKMLVAFDKEYILRELFYPYVGEENHVKGALFRFGVWINGSFSWIPKGWKIERKYIDDSLITEVQLINEEFSLKIVANDLVDFHENIYLKKISVENYGKEPKNVKLFLAQDFSISGNDIGDTVAFRP